MNKKFYPKNQLLTLSFCNNADSLPSTSVVFVAITVSLSPGTGADFT